VFINANLYTQLAIQKRIGLILCCSF